MELENAFNTLLSESMEFKLLFALNHLPSFTEAKKQNTIPKDSMWFKYFNESANRHEAIYEIDDPYAVWKRLSVWLDMVMYEMCALIPHITAERAHNLANGHPLSLWLHKYAETINASCCVGMALVGRLGTKEEHIPQCLIRLPILTSRYQTFLLPKIQEFHRESITQLWELNKEYMELLSNPKK